MKPYWCYECGRSPAHYYYPRLDRRLCAVCQHRLEVAIDLSRRVQAWVTEASAQRVAAEERDGLAGLLRSPAASARVQDS